MTVAARPFRLIGPLVLLPLMAFATAALAALAAQSGNRAIAAVGLVFCLGLAAILARNLLAVLVFTLCVAMSYNRQFYSFDAWLGDYGSFGLFWTASDAVMPAIVLAALARRAVRGRTLPAPRRHLSVEVTMVILVVAMTLSALRTDPMPPALFETLRISKYFVYFLVLRALMDRDLARVLLIGLGAMVAIQFALGGCPGGAGRRWQRARLSG